MVSEEVVATAVATRAQSARGICWKERMVVVVVVVVVMMICVCLVCLRREVNATIARAQMSVDRESR